MKKFYECNGCDNLPQWEGSDRVYSKAYRVLDAMMLRHINANSRKGRYIPRVGAWPNFDAIRLINALNDGNEEKIKGLLLMTHIYF